MDDARRAHIEDLEGDIIELEHMALSPFMLIIAIFKWGALLVFLALWTVGLWIFGIFGGDGWNARQAEAKHIISITQDGAVHSPDQDRGITFVNLGDRSAPLAFGDGINPPSQEIDHNNNTTYVGADDNRTGGAAGVSLNESGRGRDAAGICTPGSNYDYSLGPIGSRGEDAFRRKSARMRVAYQNGIIMASSMRRLLAAVKISQLSGQELMELHPGSQVYQSGNTMSLCVADPWFPGMPEGVYQAEIEASQSITIKDAPALEIVTYHGLFAGMCREEHCQKSDVGENDLSYNVTWLGDLFDDNPPLTDGQVTAERLLNDMSTDWFWLKTAHENGIHEDGVVLQLAANARRYRDSIMWPRGKPYYIDIK